MVSDIPGKTGIVYESSVILSLFSPAVRSLTCSVHFFLVKTVPNIFKRRRKKVVLPPKLRCPAYTIKKIAYCALPSLAGGLQVGTVLSMRKHYFWWEYRTPCMLQQPGDSSFYAWMKSFGKVYACVRNNVREAGSHHRYTYGTILLSDVVSRPESRYKQASSVHCVCFSGKATPPIFRSFLTR